MQKILLCVFVLLLASCTWSGGVSAGGGSNGVGIGLGIGTGLTF